MLVPSGCDDKISRASRIDHWHHPVAVHGRLKRPHRVDLGDDHVGAEAAGARIYPLGALTSQLQGEAVAEIETLHETAAGRVYAAYGGVYIAVALAWLWAVDGIRPTLWDVAGVAVALTGMGIIMFQPR